MTSTTPADDVDAFSDDDISACDDDEFFSDTIRRAGRNDAPEEKWVFQAQSKRGSAVFNDLSSRVTTSPFKLLYNPVDGYLLDKARKEIKHLLSCGRHLCAFCWDSFHNNEVPNLSPCTEKKLGLTGRRALRYESSQQEAGSPLRAKRETPSSKSLPSKENSVARMIGERLNKRAAGKPDELLATTPKKVRTSPRRKPNPLAVCP